jgi:hypothetical protein
MSRLSDLAKEAFVGKTDAEVARRNEEALREQAERESTINHALDALREWLLKDAQVKAKIDLGEFLIEIVKIRKNTSYTMDSKGEYQSIPAQVWFRVDDLLLEMKAYGIGHWSVYWLSDDGPDIQGIGPIKDLAHLGEVLSEHEFMVGERMVGER